MTTTYTGPIPPQPQPDDASTSPKWANWIAYNQVLADFATAAAMRDMAAAYREAMTAMGQAPAGGVTAEDAAIVGQILGAARGS